CCSITNSRPSFGGEVATIAGPLTRPIMRVDIVVPFVGVHASSGGASTVGPLSPPPDASGFLLPPPHAAAARRAQVIRRMAPIISQTPGVRGLLGIGRDRGRLWRRPG